MERDALRHKGKGGKWGNEEQWFLLHWEHLSDTQILYMSLLWTNGTYITSIMIYKQQWAGKPDVMFFYWIYFVFQTMRTDKHALTWAVIHDFMWSNLKRLIITFKMTVLCDFCVFDHVNCELLISGAYFLMREWKCVLTIQFQIAYDCNHHFFNYVCGNVIFVRC